MGKGVVLVFHNEEDPVLFERTLMALKARYSLVTADQLQHLLSGKQQTRDLCHLSFDDGLSSFYSIVYPLLKKYGVPVSLFVSPQVILRRKNYWFQEIADYRDEVLRSILSEMLNIPAEVFEPFSVSAILKCLRVEQIFRLIERYQAETSTATKPCQNIDTAQLLELDRSGLVTIGAHTMCHPVLQNETEVNCTAEIAGSVEQLAWILGHPVRYFAYPNGRPNIDFGEREKRILEKANITMAFSTEPDTLCGNTDLLSVPRMSFARMGLVPSNPLVFLRLNLGKNWIDIRSIGKPTEYAVREKLRLIVSGSAGY